MALSVEDQHLEEDVPEELQELLPAQRTTASAPKARFAVGVGCLVLMLGGTASWACQHHLKKTLGFLLQKYDWNSCSANGEDCSGSKCCQEWGNTCYQKNDHWASCNETCSANMKWEDGQWVEKNETVWECKLLSPTVNGANCMHSKACADAGSRCFQKNDHWASCNETCSEKMVWGKNGWETAEVKVWDCTVLSPTAIGGNCILSRVCQDAESTCYKLNDKWASCNHTCSEKMKWENGSWVEQEDKVWDCSVLSNAEANGTESESKPSCDTTNCRGCSGEQCSYCMDEAQRDCCLDENCKDCEGEACTACHQQHVEECCQGRYGGCVADADLEAASACDVSECDDKTDEDKTKCAESKQTECCLEDRCKGCSGQACTTCRAEHETECCDGKGNDCVADPWLGNCSTAACNGCGGEQCTYCMQEVHRDCCLAFRCSSCGDDEERCETCKDKNKEDCCRGMRNCDVTILG